MVKPYYPERGLDIKELLENSIRIYMESEVKKLCRQHSWPLPMLDLIISLRFGQETQKMNGRRFLEVQYVSENRRSTEL